MKGKRLLIFLFCGVLLLNGCGREETGKDEETSAAVTEKLIFESDNKEETRDSEFPEKLEKDGKKYKLSSISYRVTDKKEKDVTVRKIVETEVLAKDSTYEPKKTLIEDGITYTYKSKKEEAAVLEERYEQSVYGYTDFNKVVTKADVPATKRVTVTNEKTGLKETVTCNLSGIHPLTPVWESTYIDITFETYDADAYVWNGEVVEKNADPALDETKLLASVGADERTYKVKRIYWNGEAYEENGVLCRKARADVQRLTTYYRASYDGMIIEEEIPGVKYILTYEGKQADGEAAGYIYEIEGTAVYKRDNITVFIAVGAGILIVAAGIVGILFLIAKKKQENEEKNHTKGEIL